MNQVPHQHTVLFYSKEKSLWRQCANLIQSFEPSTWLYISDEHQIETVSQSFAKRLEEAKKILLDPEFSHYSILSIGLEAGFKSKSSFYKVFKEKTGMTPSKYLSSNSPNTLNQRN